MNKKRWTGLIALLGLVACLWQCNRLPEPPADIEVVYANWGDSAAYVGATTCGNCHTGIAHSFAHTGMGLSLDVASPSKSALWGKTPNPLFDSLNNLWYAPLWKDSALFLLEYRLEGGDTTHFREERVDYVIGSGHHTNSHLMVRNDFVTQMPFTYYTQQGKLDFPPGFEHGNNSRFSREIGLECMSCHNAMPTAFVAGSTNQYLRVDRGIDCERCHGPGSLHVNGIMRGRLVDTSAGPDLRIVNPRRLSPVRQMELCQRCHLQGNAVLAEGKSFFDFKPGMLLKEVMDVYLPAYEGQEDQFIMASHADRLKMSACFKSSKGFNCISCHNPHQPLQETPELHYNQVCSSCHGGDQQGCKVDQEKFNGAKANCISCHMPLSGATDIPHVTVHDHYIRTKYQPQKTAGNTTGLRAVNNNQPTALSRAAAFVQQVEQFDGPNWMLDSAVLVLNKLPVSQAERQLRIQIWHNQKRFNATTGLVEQEGVGAWLKLLNEKEPMNRHAWTAYRIGEAYYQINNLLSAKLFFEKAIELAPQIPEFYNKWAAVEVRMGNDQAATDLYNQSLGLQADQPQVLASQGFLLLKQGKKLEAYQLLESALKLNPNEEQALLNFAAWHLEKADKENARKYLNRLLQRYPNHPKGVQGLNYLDQLP